MATLLDLNQAGAFEKLLMSEVVQEDLIRLRVEKKIFTQDEFLEMVETVNLEMEKKRGSRILRLAYHADGK